MLFRLLNLQLYESKMAREIFVQVGKTDVLQLERKPLRDSGRWNDLLNTHHISILGRIDICNLFSKLQVVTAPVTPPSSSSVHLCKVKANLEMHQVMAVVWVKPMASSSATSCNRVTHMRFADG